MNVHVLYQSKTPELLNQLYTYNPDGLIAMKLYYEENYKFLPTMIDRFIYYMIYLSTYRMLETSLKTGYDRLSNPIILRSILKINPELLTFNMEQFIYEIKTILLTNKEKSSFLSGLCVIAMKELIIIRYQIENMDLYKTVFETFNNIYLGVI